MAESVAPAALAVRPAEAARLLGISRLKVYKLIGQGKLRAKKDGNTRLILVADIHKYLNDLPYDKAGGTPNG